LVMPPDSSAGKPGEAAFHEMALGIEMFVERIFERA
jgi:hypothetical protein